MNKALFWIGEVIGALAVFALPLALIYGACGLGFTCH